MGVNLNSVAKKSEVYWCLGFCIPGDSAEHLRGGFSNGQITVNDLKM
jgi:hypothetical protein